VAGYELAKLATRVSPFLFGVELATHEKPKGFSACTETKFPASRKVKTFRGEPKAPLSCQRKAVAEKKNKFKKKTFPKSGRKRLRVFKRDMKIPSGAPIYDFLNPKLGFKYIRKRSFRHARELRSRACQKIL